MTQVNRWPLLGAALCGLSAVLVLGVLVTLLSERVLVGLLGGLTAGFGFMAVVEGLLGAWGDGE